MQRTAGQPAFRQMGIHGGKAEGQGFGQTFRARTLMAGKQPPQFMHHGRAASRRCEDTGDRIIKYSWINHLDNLSNPVLRPNSRGKDVDVRCMF
jgi:hypothetical protein